MTSTAPTFNQVKAQVRAIREAVRRDTHVFGIHSTGRWTGDSVRTEDGESWHIAQCDSPLQMREVLQSASLTSGTTVLMTPLSDQQVDDDILLRVARRRLIPLDSWQIVKSLFDARSVDPRIARQRWIAEQLLASIPSEGYPPVSSGFLGAETVWQILLSRDFGMTFDQPDLLALLRWSTDAGNVARLRSADETYRDAAVGWLQQNIGPAAEPVLHCIVNNERPDAIPIALAAGVLHHSDATGQIDKSIGRFETQFLHQCDIEDGLLKKWHAAATEVVTLQLHDTREKNALLERADNILRDVQADEFAYLSRTSPLGLTQRLALYGAALESTINSEQCEGINQLTTARQVIFNHELSRSEFRRLERVEMSLRLVRWLVARHDGVAEPASLAEAARQQLAEDGFVDWARLTLRGGDPVRELSEAYAKLWSRVRDVREQQSRRFAQLLRDWTASGGSTDGFIPVERALDDLVAPLAAESPILLIVVDGMSTAVFHELVNDITRQDWLELAPDGKESVDPALATIPSVTEVSRTSLLSGALAQGNSRIEKAAFAAHPGLVSHSRSTAGPILFHKLVLQESDDDTSLASEVRNAIASSHRRVVGVVVNAVDDHLLKGEQVDMRWTRDTIKVLPTLLFEARSARRTVIILSDHGHVLDHKSTGRAAEGGERWRHADGEPGEDELKVSGNRVVIPPEHELIAPWTEKLRYGIKKNGYHGGLNPQEMVIPVAVLTSDEAVPDGWVESASRVPEWWDDPAVAAKADGEFRPVLKTSKPAKKKTPGVLFDMEDESTTTLTGPSKTAEPQRDVPWVTALLRSAIFEEHKQLAGRHVPPNEFITKMLGSLDDSGGKMTLSAMSRAVNMSAMRLRGRLAVIQRVLNIDGYPVLSRDEASDTIELNRELLCQQFDLIED